MCLKGQNSHEHVPRTPLTHRCTGGPGLLCKPPRPPKKQARARNGRFSPKLRRIRALGSDALRHPTRANGCKHPSPRWLRLPKSSATLDQSPWSTTHALHQGWLLAGHTELSQRDRIPSAPKRLLSRSIPCIFGQQLQPVQRVRLMPALHAMHDEQAKLTNRRTNAGSVWNPAFG